MEEIGRVKRGREGGYKEIWRVGGDMKGGGGRGEG